MFKFKIRLSGASVQAESRVGIRASLGHSFSEAGQTVFATGLSGYG